MANEVTGKTLRYLQNSVEQAIKSVSPSFAADLLPGTTTGTTSPGKESVVGRVTRTMKIDCDLLTALGVEIVTGTLTLNTKYLVTGGTVDGHTIGTIFVSDGTEECTADNKVKPLGTKIVGNTLSATIGGSPFLARSIDYNVSYDQFPSTTSGTTAPNKEIVTGRMKATTKFECLMYRATADQITNSAPASQAVVLTFASGITVTGNAILHQMDIQDEVEGICTVTYNAEWQGVPVEVGIGYLTMATSQSFSVIYEDGSSTDKGFTGNIILTDRSVAADAEGDVTVSYTGTIVGAITPSVYS